ncbi:MAG: 2-oxo acid dehydrogenase subunit E2 [Holosporales bacterium]|jgi:pyruvate dehydrogenase E2 component (dihydrolipoamide acetyltransferase)|nr:2-oxo acid dehydrogenase subunit E2 [Holosporales bacterium]
MPIVLEMPAMSPTMKKGNLVTWCKNEGDPIEVGDVLAEIDTDKATMEIESIHRGILETILIAEGTKDVCVNTPIAIIRQKSDTDEQIADLKRALETGSNAAVVQDNHIPGSGRDSPLIHSEKKVKASPLAKRIANIHGLDISTMTGTGPGGRIVKDDVLNNTLASNECAYTEIPLSGVKHLVASKLTKSKNEVPHFYMMATADVTDLLIHCKKVNELGEVRLTVTDFIIKSVALAMKEVPNINVVYHEGAIRQYSSIDISIAVATDFGLLTPIISNADKKNIREISTELKELVKLAREKRLPADRMDGGTITISNLGTHKIDSFYSIINIPQASILSIGPAIKTPVFDTNDEIRKAMIMKIGYAIDHRVIDGQDAAKFLGKITEFLNNPMALMIL